MKEADILVKKNDRLKAKRGPMKSKPRATRPNQYWGMDMTKIKLGYFGWLYLHIVLDWYSKEIIGFSLSMQSKTNDWFEALNMAVDKRFPGGIRSKQEDLIWINDWDNPFELGKALENKRIKEF